MGHTSSVISPWDSPGIKSPSTADFEGNGNGTAVPLKSWKLLPDPEAARKKYVQEMTLMPNCTMDQLELRALLEDPLSFECVFLYAKSIGRVEMMLAWTGLVRMRRSKSKGLDRVESLMKFCRQYASNPLFNSPSTCTNAFVSGMSQIEGISRALNAEEAVEAVDRLLASLLCELLLCLEEHVFTDLFRCSEEYVAMCEKLREAYNCVRVEDFDCYDEVGEGSNAIVLHCRKRSTGQNYAMKIQPKAALLHHCRQNKYRVVLEVQAYARCRHPYIASIAYAMQTATLAIMVMPVAACGDLRRSLTHTGNDQMSFDRVQFYAAEIVSALCYLHSHGILYRDLKPGNVLLNDDGHIMLADFGSLADLDGLFVDNGDPMAGVRAELENSVSMRGATNSYSRGNGQNSSHSISLSRSDSFSLLFDSKPALRKPSKDLNSTSTGMMSAGSMQSALQSGSAKQMMSVAESDDGSDKRAPPGGGPNQNSSLLVNNSNGNNGHGGDGDSISLANPRTQNQNSSSHQRDEVSSPTRHLPRNNREVDFVSARNAFRGRSKSLVGTLAYMAPEVVILFGKRKHLCVGYTEAIDWWSLGCTIYKLLTGTEPFRYISYEKLGMVFPNMLLQYPNSKEAHTAVFGTLDCSRHDDLLSKETIDLISRLLVFDADQRLGSGSRDDARKGEDVKHHAFFRGIDWIALEHKALPPPYIPHREVLHALLGDPGGTVASNGNPSAAVLVPVPVAAVSSNGRNGSGSRVIPPGPKRVFDMLKYCNKESWLGIPDQLTGKAGGGDGEGHTPSTASSHRRASRYCVPQEHQMFFREWNYVSPAAIELEMQKRNMDTNSSAGSQSAASVPSAMMGMVSQIVGAGQGESASGKCCRSPKSGGADVKYTPSGDKGAVQVAPLTPPVVGDVGCAGQMRCFNSKP